MPEVRNRQGNTKFSTNALDISVKSCRTQAMANASVAQRKSHIEAACAPHLSGRRAETWLAVWDRGSKMARLHVLEALVLLHKESNASVMEEDLGMAAPLLFTRITAWLRLTYKSFQECPSVQVVHRRSSPSMVPSGSASPYSGVRQAEPCTKFRSATVESGVTRYEKPSTVASPKALCSTASLSEKSSKATPLLLMIQAILVFLRGASYMTQFAESGLSATLTDCLETGTRGVPLFSSATSLSEGSSGGCYPFRLLTLEERRHILLLLLYLANAGRVYREVICDNEGLVQLFHALQREEDSGVCQMMTELFTILGQGNPRMSPLIHRGLIRMILCHCPSLPIPKQETPESDPGSPHPRTEKAINMRLAAYDGTFERTLSDDVTFHVARVLHYLQVTAEDNYFSLCVSEKGSPSSYRSVDLVPVVGLTPAQSGAHCGLPSIKAPGTSPDALLSEMTVEEFLDALLYLALHENTRFRVEGNELLSLAAKNIQLTIPILSRCFEVMGDDLWMISDEDDIKRMSRRQRAQLSCGRTAVSIILSTPMSEDRKALILRFIATHGAHFSLLKYLRLTNSGDTAAVVDCCKALQLLARASHAQQRAEMQEHTAYKASSGSDSSPLLQIGPIIHDAVGDLLYQALLHEEISEEESFAMLHEAKRTQMLSFASESSAKESHITPENPSSSLQDSTKELL